MQSYQKLSTAFYDLDKPAAPKDALAFLLEQVATTEEPVLEPMSGSGRFLIPLLRRGTDIEGVEPSRAMLEACRRHCAKEKLRPVVHEGFLETVALPRSYGLIFMLAGSFGLIADRGLAVGCLRKLSSQMIPGGKLVIEIETPVGRPAGPQQWNQRSIDRPDGGRMICRSRSNYDAGQKVDHVSCVYRLVRNGRIEEDETEQLAIRYYDLAEFGDLLRDTGFTDISATRPYGLAPATPSDQAAIFMCRTGRNPPV